MISWYDLKKLIFFFGSEKVKFWFLDIFFLNVKIVKFYYVFVVNSRVVIKLNGDIEFSER